MIFTPILAAVIIAVSDPVPEMQTSQGGRKVAPNAQVGRSAVREGAMLNGPFGSSTLPATGHPTRFKRYSEGQFDSQSARSRSVGSSGGAALGPYINLLRSGNPVVNYYNFQRDQQIYNTASQTQQINSQLRQATETRPTRLPNQPFTQNIDIPQTPLQRRFQPQEGAGPSGSSAEELGLLREIVRELKSIRENLPARPEQRPQEQ